MALSILKAAKVSDLTLNIVGCDIFEENAGRSFCDQFVVAPLASDEEQYISFIQQLLDEQQVQFFIPTSDHEINLVTKHRELFQRSGLHVLLQTESEWNRFNDKWLAYEWFTNHNIGTPHTCLPNSRERMHFPLIVKPRTGGGSRHIYIAEDESELQRYIGIAPNPIVQQLVLPNDAEFTAGVFKFRSGEVWSIIFRRELKFGMTNKAWRIEDSALEAFCEHVAKNTNLTGSFNIQFRCNDDGPKVLEINPRFSGTTGIRASFGFNDLAFWIKDLLDIPQVKPALKSGSVVRFMEEIYHFE